MHTRLLRQFSAIHLLKYETVSDCCDTPLAASSGTGQLQTGTLGISSAARCGARVLESTRPDIRPSKSPPAVVIYTSAARSAVPSDNIGRRSFPVAAAIVWNSLPVYLQSSPSLFTF